MVTTAAKAWFLAAARISVGPPMSMFSIDLAVLGARAATATRSKG